MEVILGINKAINNNKGNNNPKNPKNLIFCIKLTGFP